MEWLRQLDIRSVITGALTTLIVSLPAGLIGRALAGNDENSNTWIVFGLLVLVGPVLGGAIAARRHRRSAMVHGAAAATLAWVVTIVISVTGKLIDGKPVPILSSLLVGFMFVSLGIIGGYVTFRREVRSAG
jgi:putative membrane protein (TIGR04086 family)